MSYILWNTPYPVGGVTAFCVHLHKVTGWPILRLAKVNQKPRALGQWGVTYQNVMLDQLLEIDKPILLGGGTWTMGHEPWAFLLSRPNVWTVLHDETEFNSMPHTRYIRADRVIVMREHNLTHYPTAALLPQPYSPRYSDEGRREQRHKHAICTARLDGLKGTDKIIEANRLLSKRHKIHLLGAPNRLWVFGKRIKYPELNGLKGFPSTFGAGADLHRHARFGVDMTVIGNDGGVQYTLLESIDGGSIPITTSKFMPRGIGGHALLHQYTADSAKELFLTIESSSYHPNWTTANRAWLDKHHAPARVAAAWGAVVRGPRG